MNLLPPHRMRLFNGLSVIVWLIMTPVSLITGLAESVTFVSILSLWALVAASISGYVASRVEVKQHEQNIAAEVTDALLRDTTLEGVDE